MLALERICHFSLAMWVSLTDTLAFSAINTSYELAATSQCLTHRMDVSADCIVRQLDEDISHPELEKYSDVYWMEAFLRIIHDINSIIHEQKS